MRRRLGAWSILLIMILPLVPTVGAAAVNLEVWTDDRSITTKEELENGTSLEIAAGVNVSFDAPASLPIDLENNTPSLTVGNGLLINGTAPNPATFRATDGVKDPELGSLLGSHSDPQQAAQAIVAAAQKAGSRDNITCVTVFAE